MKLTRSIALASSWLVLSAAPVARAGSAASSPISLLAPRGIPQNAAFVLVGDNQFAPPRVSVRAGPRRRVIAIKIATWEGAHSFQHRRSYYLVRPQRGHWPARATLHIKANGHEMKSRVVVADKTAPPKIALLRFENATVPWGFPGRGGKRAMHYLYHGAVKDGAPVLLAEVTYRGDTTVRHALLPGRSGALSRAGHAHPHCVTVRLVDPANNRGPASKLCK